MCIKSVLIRIKSNGEEGGRSELFLVSIRCQLSHIAIGNTPLATELGRDQVPVVPCLAQPFSSFCVDCATKERGGCHLTQAAAKLSLL